MVPLRLRKSLHVRGFCVGVLARLPAREEAFRGESGLHGVLPSLGADAAACWVRCIT